MLLKSSWQPAIRCYKSEKDWLTECCELLQLEADSMKTDNASMRRELEELKHTTEELTLELAAY
jgi:FtsZ-binding cell division protein ZapB